MASISLTITLGLSTSPVSATHAATAGQAPAQAHLDQQVQQNGRVRVIVRLEVAFRAFGRASGLQAQIQRSRIAQAQDEVLERLSGRGLLTMERFEHVPYLVVEVDSDGLQALRDNPAVAGLLEDEPVPPLLAETIPLIGADTAWSMGGDGTGTSVAILDTGLDLDHEFFSGKTIHEACFSTTSIAYGSSSLCPGGTDEEIGPGSAAACAISGCDHGTHVAGIATGDGESFSGVAKAADLIAIQVFSQFSGSDCSPGPSPCVLSFASDQIAALEWLYDQRESFESTVVSANLSLGGSTTYNTACDWDAREPAISNLRAAGIGTTIASGNGGAVDGISSPACVSTAISVGATDDLDNVASFTNAGDLLDLFAPGVTVYASVIDGYGSKSGTSMAAPHAAGALAALQSGAPTANLEQALAALESTGVQVTDERTGGSVTRPRIQVDAALALLLPDPTATPTATSTATSTPTGTATPTGTPAPTATPAPSGETTWYLPEGYTGDGFGTYILIQNPNTSAANITATYMLQGGGTVERQHVVPSTSRYTIVAQDPAEVGEDAAFSARINSDTPVIVERAMYFGSGGHETLGLTQAATEWNLAEGYTGSGFGTFILVQNPNSSAVDLSVTYLLEGGGTIARNHTVPAESRYTIVAQDPAEVGPDQAFSTNISATLPVIVERAMYFNEGGHDTIALTEPASTWYLAEGYTGGGFATFILVQNPNLSAASLTVTYLLEGGGVVEREHTVPANSRYTIAAQDAAEVGPDAAFSTTVQSDVPVIVERAMYFADGGHATVGLTAAATEWYLAEGYSDNGFSTFILIQNPNDTAAELTVTYLVQGGGTIVRAHTVPAESRYTIAAHDAAEVGPGEAFSTVIESDSPVIVERSMYFDGGGHATVGYHE